MRLSRKGGPARSDPDMTPMIDVTFQLVIFFLLTLNFSMDEQNELIRLPKSELAKPPDVSQATPITVQLTSLGTVIVGGDEVPLDDLRTVLQRERSALELQGRRASQATVIIRADCRVPTGKVHELIEISQRAGFEKFILRAKEEKT